jgi:hypothetical protein
MTIQLFSELHEGIKITTAKQLNVLLLPWFHHTWVSDFSDLKNNYWFYVIILRG